MIPYTNWPAIPPVSYTHLDVYKRQVLNIISGTGAVTGYYTSADKLITTAKSGMSPISDSMYPYMVKNRDFRLIKKSLMLLMPLILVGCVVVGIFARPLCSWFFGPEFADAALVLRVMLPVVCLLYTSRCV